MPWIIPSHQAPVISLKRWRPREFSGLALVLGTAAPDLPFILRLDLQGCRLSHSLAGLVVLDVPLVLVLHVLATALVLPWLLPHVPGGAPLHLHALARCRPARDAAGVARVALSALVGAATHVFLDGFTHGNHAGWALPLLPALAAPVPHFGGAVPLHDALQFWLTLVLGAFALRDWGLMASALPAVGPGASAAWEVVPAPLEAGRRVVALLLAAALAGAAFAPLVRGAVGWPDTLRLAAYGAITFATAAAILGATADRGRRWVDKVRLDLGLSGT